MRAGGLLRRLLGIWPVLLIGVAMLVSSSLAQAQSDSSLVKATFLYRFAGFVTWPPASSGDTPVRICVMDAGAFAARLRSLVANQHLGARGFEVRTVEADGTMRQCEIVYLNGDASAVVQALRLTAGAPVLTVTDAAITPDTRGVVHFVVIDDRVRFHIDDEQAAQNHLQIDPRLLSLAISVRRRAS